MAKTDPINVANPTGGSDPKQGDDHIRTLARAVAEILGVDHYIGASSPYNEDAAGEHAKVTFHAPLTTPPTTSATQQALFTSGMDSGAAELFVRPLDDGTPIQLTSGGTVLFSSLGNIANNTYLKAANAAGDGTVDLIKASAGNKAEIPAGSVLSTSGDPTVAAGLVCKEWVEGQASAAPKAQAKADNVAGATFEAGSESETLPNGMVIKTGTDAAPDGGGSYDGTVAFGNAFPTACVSVVITGVEDNGTTRYGNKLKAFDKDGFTYLSDYADSLCWVAIGY